MQADRNVAAGALVLRLALGVMFVQALIGDGALALKPSVRAALPRRDYAAAG